ncbi:MAG: FAD-dependent oxidoreductase [Acidimicrobiia bacterium]|nr:FAD-dependent oxidoreductase [Acidimicrobiia bacterium]
MAGTAYDVVVVGAGTAGANTAYQFARRGRRVLLVERRSAAVAGAQWHNAVLDRHFVDADLDPPAPPERVADGGTVHLRARDPLVGPTLHDAPTVAADMVLLGARLRALAASAGTEIVDEVGDMEVGLDSRSGRIRSLTLHRPGGSSPSTITASLFVDASGRNGVLRRHASDLTPWCPPVQGDELCSASDVHHGICDADGAREFLARHGARLGDVVSLVGVNGGFSTCGVTISADLDRVRILVGCLANGRYGTAAQMLADLCRREPWIGPARTTGSGVIPLRRPYARITAAGIALVGDAACQVFPAHGSGIGIGLLAGTMLAAGVGHVDDPGDPHELWRGYQTPFQHRLGCDRAGDDALRRATTRLGSAGVDALLRSGLADERTVRAGLEQRWETPPAGDAVRSAGRLLRNPRLAAVMVPALARAQLVRSHAIRYPDRLDVDALARWERRTVRLLGPLPR